MLLIGHELRKVWKNKTFLLALVVLMCVNLFLVWTQSSPSAGRQGLDASYRKLASELVPMDMTQKEEYITSLYAQVEAMVTIDNIQRQTALLGAEYTVWLRERNADIIDEYYDIYASGDYLLFTSNLNEEYAFLNSIRLEFEQVNNYDEFLLEIDEKANTLQSISIFATGEDDFTGKSIRKTASDFAGMENINPDFFPQKGLRTAIGFVMTDLIFLFIMMFLAFVLVRDEMDSGLIFLIRTTPRGRLHSALAKIAALAGSLLVITILLFGTNLVFCGFRFGLGDLYAPIQSYAFLMRSTLKVNVLVYLGYFFVTKWIGVFIVGLWIILSCTLSRRAFPGYLLAIAFPLGCEALRNLIPAISRYNLLRYANVASLVQTNEILGGYRNLNVAGVPVHLFTVEIATALIYLLVFSGVFCVRFCGWQIRAMRTFTLPTGIAALRARASKRLPPSRMGHERHKILAMSGGALVILLFAGLQLVFLYNTQSFITPKEIYYRNYMEKLEGPLTREKAEWLNEELETFRPILVLQQKLQNGEITQQAYEFAMGASSNPEEKYEVYLQVLEKARTAANTPGRQMVYDTGYKGFFGLSSNADLIEYLTVCAALCLFCAPVFALEKRSGMTHLLRTTPLGGRKTVTGKLYICGAVAVITALLSLLGRFVVMVRDYWFSVPWAPLWSLDDYFAAPQGMPIMLLIIGMVAVRAAGALCVMAVILAVSEKAGNMVISIVLSLVIFCLSPVLALAGIDGIKWVGAFPLFHFASMMQYLGDTAAVWLYLFLWGMVGGLCIYYLYSKCPKE